MKSNDIYSYLDVKTDRFRCIFFDLDGTLLTSDKQISRRTIAYLKHLHETYDFRFGIASGRNITSILPLVDHYQLDCVFDVIVANNGADIVSLKERKVDRCGKIEKAKVMEVIQRFIDRPEIIVFFHDRNKLYSTGINRVIRNIQKANHEDQIIDLHSCHSFQSPSRIALFASDEEMMEEIKNVSFEQLKGYHSEPQIYEYVRSDISKSNGIFRYVSRFGKSLHDVMAFGDGNNDVEMLSECRFGICMKNGTSMAGNAADFITPCSNDEDGITAFLQTYIKE